MNPEITASVEQDKQALLDFTCDLIAVASENPPGAFYEEAIHVLTRHLSRLGFDWERNGDCLLSFVGEREDRTLYFSGHYDVVPAQHPDLFKPVVKGKNLFGRGSSDMKGGLAAMIYAAKVVRDSGIKLNGRIGLVFVPDEETAGPGGSRFLEKEGLLGRGGIGMLTPEPTGGVVWNANRGAITLRLTVHGKPAHVGRQFEGINAFEGMMRLAQKLTDLKNEVELRTTAFDIHPEPLKRSILMLGGQAGGGTNFNVVPETCWFTVDRRINPEEDFEAEKARLIELVAQESGDPAERN